MNNNTLDFDFKGTILRMPYFLRSVGVSLAQLISATGGVMMLDGAPVVAVLVLLAVLPLAVIQWALTTRRVRSTGLNPWFVLTLLIPYVGMAFSLFVLFAPEGTVGDKK